MDIINNQSLLIEKMRVQFELKIGSLMNVVAEQGQNILEVKKFFIKDKMKEVSLNRGRSPTQSASGGPTIKLDSTKPKPATDTLTKKGELNGGVLVGGERRKSNAVSEEIANNTASAGDDQPHRPEDEWKTVTSKRQQRRRKPVISGTASGTNCGLSAVPKKNYLHVTRLTPNTSCDDVLNFLRPHFDDVECEKLQSRYPQFYSSFKVGVQNLDFKRALSPDVWPLGVQVSQFFRSRSAYLKAK